MDHDLLPMLGPEAEMGSVNRSVGGGWSSRLVRRSDKASIPLSTANQNVIRRRPKFNWALCW
jgi:hypothetical protein